MNARRLTNFIDQGVVIKIDNDHLRSMREIETARLGVDCENIPAAFATDRDLVQEFVWLLRDKRCLTERN